MTAGEHPALALCGVTVAYGASRALDAVDFVAQAGRVAALVGESGSGKTTLLRLAIGLVAPSAGTVRALGEDPARTPIVRRSIGYVVQEGGLFPHLTARDNVTLPAVAAGWGADRAADRVAALADLVGLTADDLSRRPGALSGGQRQRVSLMRALLLEPALLLLDEPLGALDPLIRYELQGDLARLFASLRAAVVLVTHDLAEAAWFTDDLTVLRNGRIEQRGTLRELREAPATRYVSALLGAVRTLPV